MMKSQILMQATFGVFALGAFGAVDFVTRKSSGGPDYGFGTYVSDVASRIHFKTGKEKVLLVADMFPPPPAGWEVHDYVAEDLTRITGKPVEQKQKKVSTLAVMTGAAMPMAGADKGEYRTYTRGNHTVLFKINYIKSSVLTGIGGDAIQTMLAMQSLSDPDKPYFASVRGLRFYEDKEKAYGVARRLSAKLGPQFDLTLVTLEDDETVLRLLEGLDVASMNQMLLDPLPDVGEGDVTQAPPVGLDPQRTAAAAQLGQAMAADGMLPPGDAQAQLEASADADGSDAAPSKGFLGSLFGGKGASAPAKVEPLKIECAIEQGAKRCKVGG